MRLRIIGFWRSLDCPLWNKKTGQGDWVLAYRWPFQKIHTGNKHQSPLLLLPNIMPFHVIMPVRWNGNQTVYLSTPVILPIEVASKPWHCLQKTGVGAHNLKAHLIIINYILCPNICSTQRIVLIPDDKPLVLVQWQKCRLTSCRQRLSPQTK